MNLDLCKKCGGRGFTKKAVFPNSHEKVPCQACEERMAKALSDPNSNVSRALVNMAIMGAVAKAQS